MAELISKHTRYTQGRQAVEAANEKLSALLLDIQQLDADKHRIVLKLRELADTIAPDSHERVMYGGIVVYLQRPVCGFFVHQKHVTVELERGVEIPDTWGVLEGTGKNRRHLKLTCMDDLSSKRVKTYLQRAFALN